MAANSGSYFVVYSVLGPFGPGLLMLGTLLMTGAGWWCQFVRYPSFRDWSYVEFPRRHAWHAFQISLIVVPGLILQIAGAILLSLSSVEIVLKAVNAICLVGSLGPTFLMSAPLHGRLSKAKNGSDIEKLIRTNLMRTLFWTIHLLIAIGWGLSAGSRE